MIRNIFILILFTALLPVSACTFARGEISISRLPDFEIKSSHSPKFDRSKYHSILVVLPDIYNPANVVMADETGEPADPGSAGTKSAHVKPKQGKSAAADVPHPTLTLSRSQDYDFVINEAERYLLDQGYNIISRDIIARIDEVESQRYGQKSYLTRQSPTQLALLLGQKTNADAILVITHLGVWPTEMNYLFNNQRWSFESRPKPQDSEGVWIMYHLWEVTIEVKLIDIKTGEVVWMGGGRNWSQNLFPEDWQGEVKVVGDETTTISENFRLEDFNTYNYLYKQVSALEKSVLGTME